MLASSLRRLSQVTVAKKPAHRGERDISRKAIAQGMSECFRCPVCSCAPTVQFLAHETAGAARTRHSLRPRSSREAKEFASLGRNRAARILFVVPAQAGTHTPRRTWFAIGGRR